MAGVELVSDVQSPALATIAILFGVLPLVTIVIHHGRQCAETSAAGLPVRMMPVLAAAAGQVPADTICIKLSREIPSRRQLDRTRLTVATPTFSEQLYLVHTNTWV